MLPLTLACEWLLITTAQVGALPIERVVAAVEPRDALPMVTFARARNRSLLARMGRLS